MPPRADKVNKATKRPSKKPARRTTAKTSLQTDTAVYFWRESDPNFGFLSQWYYCPFADPKDPSIVYATAEHYMMYQKALLFADTSTASAILAAPSPQTARSLGRTVTPFSDATWNANRERIVTEGSVAKFRLPVSEEGFQRGSGGEAWDLPVVGGKGFEADDEGKEGEEGKKTLGRLAAALLETGDRELVEASPRDRIWGVGFGSNNAEGQRARWGLNLLGKALMEARRVLREGEA